MFGKRVACTINPSLEIENEDTIKPSNTKKKILVIGGGPAGMEAAYVAKKRGHDVVLCDKNEELGGLMKIASVPIAKQDLAKVTQYMAKKLEEAGVEIRLNCKVDKDMLQNEFADYEVVMSNGAAPVVIQPFTKFKHWATADDILDGKAFPGRRIVVIGGGSVGCETADYLAPLVYDRLPRDRKVTVIEMAPEIMATESGPGRSLLVQRMMKKGIELICNAKVEKVEEDKIYYSINGETHCISDADTLIFAVGYRADKTLADTLNELKITYHTIGDANSVGTIQDAIHAGYTIAKEL